MLCHFLSQTLWSQRLSPNYHLMVCLAILDKHRHVIMENEFGFTEILKVGMVGYSILLFSSIFYRNDAPSIDEEQKQSLYTIKRSPKQ